MAVFISYSHSDELIVNKLAVHLVKHNANVWVGTWELNVGDSILNRVQDAIAKVTNADQGCLEQDDGTVDWSEDWDIMKVYSTQGLLSLISPNTLPMTFLTQIYVFCNEVATNRYKQYEAAGLDWIGRAAIAEALFYFGEKNDFRVILDNQFPQELKATIADPKTDSAYDIICESRKMGQDNGKDQLINISDYTVYAGR